MSSVGNLIVFKTVDSVWCLREVWSDGNFTWGPIAFGPEPSGLLLVDLSTFITSVNSALLGAEQRLASVSRHT